MKVVQPLNSDVIKVGIDALQAGDPPGIFQPRIPPSLKGSSFIDQEYNKRVFLLSNLYYSNTLLRITRISTGTGTEYFESSPLLGRWHSPLLALNKSREVAYGKLPNGVELIATGSSNNRSLKVSGRIVDVIGEIFPKPVKYDSYPIYNKGYVVRYHFIPPLPMTKMIYAIDISLNWSDLRDAFIRQVEDQKFQDSNKNIVTGSDYVDIQKSNGFYGD